MNTKLNQKHTESSVSAKPVVAESLEQRATLKNSNFLIILSCCLIMLALPLIVKTNSVLLLLTNIFILAVFAMSYDLLLGYTGIISFGHTMFFGLGAYSMGLSLTLINHDGLGLMIAFVVTVCLCFIVSLFVGLLSLRLKDTFYALITLAVATIFVILAEQWRSLTKGNDGFNFTANIPKDLFGFINLIDRQMMYFVALFFLIMMFLVLRRFIYSPVGRILQAIRENEQRVASLGYPVLQYKLISNVVAGIVAGLAGMVYALSIRFVNPDSVLGVHQTIDVLLMTVIGGVGTLYGAIIGAGVIEISSHWLMSMKSVHPIFERWVIFFGLIFILIILFFPAGIVGTIKQKWAQSKERGNA